MHSELLQTPQMTCASAAARQPVWCACAAGRASPTLPTAHSLANVCYSLATLLSAAQQSVNAVLSAICEHVKVGPNKGDFQLKAEFRGS